MKYIGDILDILIKKETCNSEKIYDISNMRNTIHIFSYISFIIYIRCISYIVGIPKMKYITNIEFFLDFQKQRWQNRDSKKNENLF